MNTPNPLIPQGTLDRQSKGKSTARIAIFTIVSIHAVFFAGLLMQGCRPDSTKGNALKLSEATATNQLPPLDGNSAPYYSGTTDVSIASATPPVVSNIPPAASEPIATPPPPASIASEPAGDGKAYKITKGDTLAKVAKANGVTLNAILRANPHVEASKLKVGQTIQIPSAAPAAALGFAEPGKAESNATAGAGNVHVVRPGETLTRIAKQHNTTVKAIQAANNLKTQRLVTGQKLKLPAGQTASAVPETGKLSTTSKMTATNPALVTPMSLSTPTNMR